MAGLIGSKGEQYEVEKTVIKPGVLVVTRRMQSENTSGTI